MRKAILIIGFLFLSLSFSSLAKADFAKGLKAAEKGDYETALKEWLIDADQGHAKAQYNLGLMYDNGEGVPENYAEAANWFRLAADQGHADAQYSLGQMYAIGEGVPEDETEAVTWYRLAADQGHVEAQLNLGFMYSNGYGIPVNYVLAYMWFNIAAAKGNDDAIYGKEIFRPFLTPEQIDEAQRLSTEWLEEHK